LFTWDYLYFLGSQQTKLWQDYEARLVAAGMQRHATMVEKSAQGCASH
jgi:DUF971 family protein